MAVAMATRCFSPPDRCPVEDSIGLVTPAESSASWIRSSTSDGSATAVSATKATSSRIVGKRICSSGSCPTYATDFARFVRVPYSCTVEASTNPAMARTRVDFPPPLGPVMRTLSPGEIFSETSRSVSKSEPLKANDQDLNDTRLRDISPSERREDASFGQGTNEKYRKPGSKYRA